MLDYCDSFKRYNNLADLQTRYSIFKNVDMTSISGVRWLVTNTGSVRLAALPRNSISDSFTEHHWHSYSFNFIVTSVSSYPFYISAIGINNVNSASIVSGCYAIQVNSDRSITLNSPDVLRLTSTNAPGSIAPWTSATGIVDVTGGINVFAFNVNMLSNGYNRLWINGHEYGGVGMPFLSPTSGIGVVLGCPKGEAQVLYNNFFYRARMSGEMPPMPPLTHNWVVDTLNVTGYTTYSPPTYTDFIPSGASTITEAISGIDQDSYVVASSNTQSSANLILFEQTNRENIQFVQTNVMNYTPTGNALLYSLNPIGAVGFTMSSTSSVYNYYYHPYVPNISASSIKWTKQILNRITGIVLA